MPRQMDREGNSLVPLSQPYSNQKRAAEKTDTIGMFTPRYGTEVALNQWVQGSSPWSVT